MRPVSHEDEAHCGRLSVERFESSPGDNSNSGSSVVRASAPLREGPEVGGSTPSPSTKPDRLYFVVRSDLPEGRRCAQLIHAADEWAALHGPQQGTVIVYEALNEQELLDIWDAVGEAGVLFREPDLGDEATAFATAEGPIDLPLLGSSLARAKRKWHKKALRRARAFAAVARPVEVDRPSPPTTYDCHG